MNFLNCSQDGQTTHEEKSNPLNSRTQTAGWLRSTVETCVRESNLKPDEIMAIVKTAVEVQK
jgi:hypothetical protein